jgi:hypothetical protein
MIFRWLYKRRVRALFGQYMLPGAFEEKIAPLLRVGEAQAFRSLVASYFPNSQIAKASANELIALRNQIKRALHDSTSKG